MKPKNHSRAPDKKGFSIALPITLIDALTTIANHENRSRNRQIQHFLEKSVQEWQSQKRNEAMNTIRQDFSMVADSPGNESSPSIPAAGAKVRYPAGQRRKQS
jgi:hypothetical protein